MTQDTAEQTMTPRDMAAIVFRQKIVVATTVAVTLAAVYIGLQMKTPVFESEVKILIQARKHIDSPYYRDIAEFRSSERILTQSEMVTSTAVIDRVVAYMGKEAFPPEYEKTYCTPLKAILVDLRLRKYRRMLAQFSPEEQQAVVFRNAAQKLHKNIKVTPVRSTDIFIIKVRDFSPRRAAQLANAVSRSYSMFDLEQQLGELQQVYGDKHVFVTHLKAKISQFEKTLSGDILNNDEAFSTATVKIIEQATPATEPVGRSSALVLMLAGMLSGIGGVLISYILDTSDTTFKSPKQLKNQLCAWPYLGYVPRATSRITAITGAVRGFGAMSLGIFYGMLIARVLVETLALDYSNEIVRTIINVTRFLIPPKAAASSGSFDAKVLVRFVVAMLGATGVYALLRYAIARLIADGGKKRILIQPEQTADESVRAYRILSENITLTLGNPSGKSMVVTSSLPQEGKTSLIANIGIYLAHTSAYNLLLVDANFRNPQLHALFSLENHIGFADMLAGGVGRRHAQQRINARLSVISAGSVRSASVARLSSPSCRSVLGDLQNEYDLILLDTPDLTNFKDAALLAACVDGAVMLVQEGKVRQEVFRACADQLLQNKAVILGTILSQRTFPLPPFLYKRL